MLERLLSHAWTSALGVSALGASALLALGCAGLFFNRAPAQRHAWGELVLVLAAASMVLLTVPMQRPLLRFFAPTGSESLAIAPAAARMAPSGQSGAPWMPQPASDSIASFAFAEALVLVIAAGGAIWALLLIAGAVRLIGTIVGAESLPDAGGQAGRKVAWSHRVKRPFCVGTRRFGAVLVPQVLATQACRSELAAVLAHEHAHLDAGHGRARLVAALAAPLLYWNPLYWMLVRRMRADAELCADAVAAGAVGRASYVRALLAVAERMPRQVSLPSPTVGALSSPPVLLDRMESLMSRSQPLDATPAHPRRKASIAVALAGALLLNAACGATGGMASQELVDYQAITFEVLDLEGTSLAEELEEGGSSSAPFPARVQALDQNSVVLDGYMIPLAFEGNEVSEFMLLRDNYACCMGGAPKWGHWIHCKLEEGATAPYSVGQPIRVKGQFDAVHPAEWPESEFTQAVYELHHWAVVPSE